MKIFSSCTPFLLNGKKVTKFFPAEQFSNAFNGNGSTSDLEEHKKDA